jgi:hypothetical protein
MAILRVLVGTGRNMAVIPTESQKVQVRRQFSLGTTRV